LVIVLSVFLFQTCSTLKTERAQREFIEKQNAQNLSALKDSITVQFDKKLKAFVFEKDNYVVNELKDLKTMNADLYSKLNKVKGDIIAAIDSKVTVDMGEVTAGNQLVTVDKDKNLYGLNFATNYKDDGFEQTLEGQSRFKAQLDKITNKWVLDADSTLFTKNLTTINITYGFRDLKDKYEVFAISPSPKVKINQLDGVFILDKAPQPMPVKPKRFGFGPYVGAGLNIDFNLTNPRFGWSIGVAVHYDIFQWRFGKK
jgi:hypothetical protein